MKNKSLAFAGAVIAALAVAAPAASALPTGSSLPASPGDGREVVILDNTLELSDLDSCWASGFPRDIRVENRSSRAFLLYASSDCTGEPVASVAPKTVSQHHGWSGRAAR